MLTIGLAAGAKPAWWVGWVDAAAIADTDKTTERITRPLFKQHQFKFEFRVFVFGQCHHGRRLTISCVISAQQSARTECCSSTENVTS